MLRHTLPRRLRRPRADWNPAQARAWLQMVLVLLRAVFSAVVAAAFFANSVTTYFTRYETTNPWAATAADATTFADHACDAATGRRRLEEAKMITAKESEYAAVGHTKRELSGGDWYSCSCLASPPAMPPPSPPPPSPSPPPLSPPPLAPCTYTCGICKAVPVLLTESEAQAECDIQLSLGALACTPTQTAGDYIDIGGNIELITADPQECIVPIENPNSWFACYCVMSPPPSLPPIPPPSIPPYPPLPCADREHCSRSIVVSEVATTPLSPYYFPTTGDYGDERYTLFQMGQGLFCGTSPFYDPSLNIPGNTPEIGPITARTCNTIVLNSALTPFTGCGMIDRVALEQGTINDGTTPGEARSCADVLISRESSFGTRYTACENNDDSTMTIGSLSFQTRCKDACNYVTC